MAKEGVGKKKKKTLSRLTSTFQYRAVGGPNAVSFSLFEGSCGLPIVLGKGRGGVRVTAGLRSCLSGFFQSAGN